MGAAIFNAGMKGRKGDVYEGGHRVPMFIHWPGGGLDQEKRVDTLTNITDVVPTLVDLCGLEISDELHFDGQSLRPLLEQGDSAPWPDRIVMVDEQHGWPIRKWKTTIIMTERWRLIENRELYDIQADFGQENNVYDQHPEVVQQLGAWYDQLWHEEIEPELQDISEIPVGAEPNSEVILAYHDCCHHRGGWFQDAIRYMEFKRRQEHEPRAFWPIHVNTPGTYRIELRRWPIEVDLPIRSLCDPAPVIYGVPRWHREHPAVALEATTATLIVGEQTETVPVGGEDKASVFHLTLPEGSTRLTAYFNDGQHDTDAFYVHVIKTD